MRCMILSLIVMASAAVSAVGGDGGIPNRLPQAKVGEWILMQDVSGGNDGEKTRVTVVGGGEGEVVVKRERLAADGTVVESREHAIDLGRYAARMAEVEGKAKQIGRERLAIKGKEFSVVVVSWDNEDGEPGKAPHEFKIWVSEELPIGGVAKTWSSDPAFPSTEVVDFGFAQ